MNNTFIAIIMDQIKQVRKPRAYKNVCASECVAVLRQNLTNRDEKNKQKNNKSDDNDQKKNNFVPCNIG